MISIQLLANTLPEDALQTAVVNGLLLLHSSSEGAWHG